MSTATFQALMTRLAQGPGISVESAPPGVVNTAIANAQSLTAAIDLDDKRLHRIHFNGWSAAAVSFQVSVDGLTFHDLFDKAGAEVTIPSFTLGTGIGRAVVVDPVLFLGARYIKIRSGVSAAAVAQGAARALVLSTVAR